MGQINYWLSKKEEPHFNQIFLKFENIFKKIKNEHLVIFINLFLSFPNIIMKNGEINTDEFNLIYGNLKKGLRRFKRDVENNYKFDKTDVECFLEKLKLENKEIVLPLKNDLNLKLFPRMNDFG